MAISKELRKHIYTAVIGAGLIGTTIFGTATLAKLETSAGTQANLDNITKSVVSSDAHINLVREQECAILNAYKNGVIDADEFTKQMRDVHSERFAYNNRYKVTNEQTAKEWEKAEEKHWNEQEKLVGCAIGAGASIAAVGFAVLNRGYNRSEELEKKNRKKEQLEDEHYHGA